MTPSVLDDDARRFARHLSLTGFGADGQARLRQARVLVVGAGGLGSPVISALAGCGVGRLVVVDPDVVELSNLPRQLIHDESSIGSRKVTSAARAVARLNSHVEVVEVPERLGVRRALDLVADVDVVVDCSDSVDARYVLNDACVLLGVPLVWASIAQFAGQFGVVDPGVGPCYRCIFPDPRTVRGVATCEEAGVLGVLPGVLGMMQAVEVVKVCVGLGSPARDAVRLYDASSATMTTLPVARDPQCPVCGLDVGYFDGVDEVSSERCGAVAIGPEAWPGGEYVLVDVRGQDEADAEPLATWMRAAADAIRLEPWGSGWSAASARDVLTWAGTRDVVLVCARGVRSRAAAQLLAEVAETTSALAGRVMSLHGGLAAAAER